MKIEIPNQCPSCGTILENVNGVLYCRNKFGCKEQVLKAVENHVKALGIQGLGEKTLSKLDLGNLYDIYYLDTDYITDKIGSVKNAEKIVSNIREVQKLYFSTFLHSLGIKFVGKSTAKKISQVCNKLDEITEDSLIEAGIGPKTREIILEEIEFVPDESNFPFDIVPDVKVCNKGKVCVSGKVPGFKNRNEVKVVLEELGYSVTTSVSKNTDYLICYNTNRTKKVQEALSLGVTITTLEELKNGCTSME